TGGGQAPPPGLPREHVWKLSTRGDVELAERSSQAGLDRFLGDEQRLGDLAVGAAGCGELDYASFAGSQGVRSGLVGGPRPDADRCELCLRATLQGARAAAGGEREPLEQRLSGCGSLSSRAKRGTEVNQYARMLEPRRRGGEHLE